MNCEAVAAFDQVARLARLGRRDALARELSRALELWDRPRASLPAWFRPGAVVESLHRGSRGRRYVVESREHDKRLRLVSCGLFRHYSGVSSEKMYYLHHGYGPLQWKLVKKAPLKKTVEP